MRMVPLFTPSYFDSSIFCSLETVRRRMEPDTWDQPMLRRAAPASDAVAVPRPSATAFFK